MKMGMAWFPSPVLSYLVSTPTATVSASNFENSRDIAMENKNGYKNGYIKYFLYMHAMENNNNGYKI